VRAASQPGCRSRQQIKDADADQIGYHTADDLDAPIAGRRSLPGHSREADGGVRPTRRRHAGTGDKSASQDRDFARTERSS
jgi:hypothetical protein